MRDAKTRENDAEGSGSGEGTSYERDTKGATDREASD